MDELMGELVRLGFLLTLWAFGIWVGGRFRGGLGRLGKGP